MDRNFLKARYVISLKKDIDFFDDLCPLMQKTRHRMYILGGWYGTHLLCIFDKDEMSEKLSNNEEYRSFSDFTQSFTISKEGCKESNPSDYKKYKHVMYYTRDKIDFNRDYEGSGLYPDPDTTFTDDDDEPYYHYHQINKYGVDIMKRLPDYDHQLVEGTTDAILKVEFNEEEKNLLDTIMNSDCIKDNILSCGVYLTVENIW